MSEPDSTSLTTLTVTHPERMLLERMIVIAAPGLQDVDRRLAMSLWERVATDTVAP